MATATMGVSSVDRLARSKRPTVERTEIHIPPAPVFPLEAVTGDPRMRVQAVAAFNNALQKWRNDAWSIEAPFVPDAELQADVAKLEDTTAKLVTKLDRAAVDIRRAEANITTISTNVTSIDNSITTINNQITVIESNAITGTGIVQANGTGPPTAIMGTQGHVPYWNASGPPYLSATSPIYIDGTNVGIGTDLPVFLLDLGLAGTTAGVMRLAGSASGNVIIQTAAAAGSWTLTLPTTDGAANEFLKTNGTGVTSWSSVVLTTDVTGLLPTANGGTNHGVWTPGSVIFAGAGGLLLTEDNANLFYDDALNRLGVGLAVPLSKLHVAIDDAVTTVTDVLRINHSLNTGGTAANFGTGILLTGETSTTDAQEMARIQTIWTTSTHATRTSALQFQTVNSAAALATYVTLLGNGYFGIGTVSPPSLLSVVGSFTTTAAIIGSSFTYSFSPSGAPAAEYGAQFKSTFATAQSHNNGANILARTTITGTNTGNNLVGITGFVETTGAAAGNAIEGMRCYLDHGGSGTITAFYGIRMMGVTANAGTIVNTYGFHVGDMTIGTQTNVPYSFISIDANARQSFAGNTGMGGGLSVGDGGTTMTLGVVNATVGYRIANAAASGTYLRGNGTNFIGSALLPGDFAYAFTEGSVIFAGAGGTSLAEDNANLFWNNAANALGIGINTFAINERLHVYNADALTASNGLVLIENDATSATVAVNKYGLIVESNGNWTGAGSTVYGISSRANDGTGGSTQVAGVFGWAEGGSALVKGIYGLAGATVAGVTSSIGVHGVSSNSVAPTNAYGGLFSAAGGTDNYSICCVAGKIKNDTVESLICSNAALATNATFGFLYIPTCAGAPTGVPVTETGTCAHLFNTTSNKLAIYDSKWFQFSPYEVKSYDVADTGNVGIGEDTLRTYTIPGGTMSDNGDSIEFYAAGTFATSINSKRLRVQFGATTIFDSGALAITTTADWCLDGSIIRTGATTQRAIVTLTTSSGTLSAYADYTAPGETLSGNVNLDITGEATSNDDIVCTLFKLMYLGTS